MKRAAAIGLAIVLAACASPPDDPTPTPQPRPSVADDVQDGARTAVEAFLAAMADPEVTYRVTGELRVGQVDADGRPDILVWTRYDVKGGDFAGRPSIHLRDPSVGGDFSLVVLDGTAHVGSSVVDRFDSMEVPDSLYRPDAIQRLTANDLSLLGRTDDGLFEFAIARWLGGDPLGQWVDLGAVSEGALPHTDARWHDSRLFLDEAGVPQRFVHTWEFETDASDEHATGTIVEEFEGLGMYVTLAAPDDGMWMGETSHDIIIGVDEDHVIITEPWIEISPDEGHGASLSVAFPPPDQPILLGIEGAIFFIGSHDADGNLILDRKVANPADTIDIPPGEQTLVAYYRTCDGNCGLLDPPHDFCVVEADIEEGARYELTVEVLGMHRAQPATCTLTPATS